MTSEKIITSDGIVLTTSSGERIVVNNKDDECIYAAPCEVLSTYTEYDEGSDLYRHVTRIGGVHYYFYHWSRWNENNYEPIDKSTAKQFLQDKLDRSYPERPSNVKEIEELFPRITE